MDELVFDGRSMLLNRDSSRSAPGPLCSKGLLIVDYGHSSGVFEPFEWAQAPQENLEEIYRVLITGLRDYVLKNGFSEVVFGLSGGIDSALTLALSVDALGPERMHTVMMPSRYTSQASLDMAHSRPWARVSIIVAY